MTEAQKDGGTMAKISDEMREWAELQRKSIYTMRSAEKLDSIADRIDSEMVELPKDADGKPLHLGDTVYDPVGLEHEIAEISFTENYDHTIMEPTIVVRHGCNFIYPKSFTHSKPEPEDSWKRIADELDEWCDSADVDGDACGKPRDLAERIRRLAKEEAQ